MNEWNAIATPEQVAAVVARFDRTRAACMAEHPESDIYAAFPALAPALAQLPDVSSVARLPQELRYVVWDALTVAGATLPAVVRAWPEFRGGLVGARFA